MDKTNKNSNILVTARSRIIQFIDIQGINPKDFLKKTGVKKGFIDKSHQSSGATDIYLSKILEGYPEINPGWLLTGKGSMLLDNNNDVVSESVVSEPEAVYKTTPVKEKEPLQAVVLHPEIQFLREKIKDKEEIINLHKERIKLMNDTIIFQKEGLKDKEETIISQKEKLKENEEKIRQAGTLIHQLKKHLAELQEKWAELNKRLPKEKKYNPSTMDVGNKLPAEPPANQSRLTMQHKLQEDKRKGLIK